MGDARKGSKYYAVLTVGKKDEVDKVSRFSRTGDDFLRCEMADDRYTYRMEMYDGEVVLLRCKKRWTDAQGTPEGLWEVLHSNAETVIEDLADKMAEGVLG